MKSTNLQIAQQPMAFDCIPMEIWDNIVQELPVSSLPSFVKSCRKFHQCGNPHLYRTVRCYSTKFHYGGNVKAIPSLKPCFGVHREQAWLLDPIHGSEVNNLSALLRTITENATLSRHILGASFRWYDTTTALDVLATKRCLDHLRHSVQRLHVDIPTFDTDFALTSNVTFLEIEYPSLELLGQGIDDSRYDMHLHQTLRDKLYSIFCIPTLRHLTLKNARSFDSFISIPSSETWRVGTSSITSLRMPNTIPLSNDLEEMLTWPRALRTYYHENVLGERGFFISPNHQVITSPRKFIQGLHGQRHALEELVYNNAEDKRYQDQSKFGQSLREFARLKRLVVPLDCFINDWEDNGLPLCMMLPPSLGEMWFDVGYDDVYDSEELPHLIQELRKIALNKARWFPSLKTMVLWIDSCWDPSVPPLQTSQVLEDIGLSATFEEVGILLDCALDSEYSKMNWRG